MTFPFSFLCLLPFHYFLPIPSVPNPTRLRMECLGDIVSGAFYRQGSNTLAMLGFVHAVSAGFCAALASSCAKLAMSPELQRKFWCDFLLQSVFGGSTLTSLCHTVSRGSCTINNFDIKRQIKWSFCKNYNTLLRPAVIDDEVNIHHFHQH